jgi:uncharacterized protein (TIGR00369 family)
MSSAQHGMSRQEFQHVIDRMLPVGSGLGFKVETVGAGSCRLRMPFRAEMVRPGGTIAGPATMTLADCAMYGVVLGMKRDALMAVTSNLSIHFLRAPKQADLVAEGKLLRLGRRLAVIEVAIFSEGEEEPVAHATGTYALPTPTQTESSAVP